MPLASSGNVISSSAQLGADVVTSPAIKDGEIVNADVAAGAAIAYSKLSLNNSITNADLAGSIADSKLNQITTASKISGAAITSLASLPAGAGVIPAANLPGAVIKGGQTTYGATTGSGNQTIAHGLGKVPSFIEIECILAGSNTAGNLYTSYGTYDGTNTSNIHQSTNTTTGANQGSASDSTYICYLMFYDGTAYQRATVTMDATNITLAWTYAATLSGTILIKWKAFG